MVFEVIVYARFHPWEIIHVDLDNLTTTIATQSCVFPCNS